MKPRFQINIHFDGTQYVANVPELANCSGVGASYIEAVTAAEAAIVQWVADAISTGGAVPAPSVARGAAKSSTLRHVSAVAPCVVPVSPTSAIEKRTVLDELVTDPYNFRRRRYNNQSGFWQRFGVSQSSGSRYERRTGERRMLPMPLAILVGLWALGCIDDQVLADVYADLVPHYPDRPTLELDDAQNAA